MGDTQIRIAIIGGGMAGAILANALVRIPHINVQVFESAPEFSERGAALGLSKNAQDALQEILPAPKDTLQKAGGVPMASTRLMMGSGPAAGNLLFDFADAKGADEIIVHRASLLRELLEPLPKEILHANKKLAAIDSSGDSVKITFADETVHEFDAVIGADGISSSVRDHIMSNLDGNEQETFSATAAGFWDTRVLVPMEKAKEKLGAELFKVDRQYGWLGDNAFIMHDIVEDGTVVHCVISGIEQETPKDRKTTLTKEGLTRTLKSWLGERIADGIIEVCLLHSHRPEMML
jgi:salicylate hydroxylase